MRTRPTDALPLHGWSVLSLRPRGQHAGLRGAARRLGARTVALSPLAIHAEDSPVVRADLAQALAADIVLFTSPNAVRRAAALHPLSPVAGQAVLAVGRSTRDALQRRGIDAAAPSRMDSEGVLGMPQLASVQGRRIGLVTGAGGRDLLAPALRQRGADVRRVDAYRRVPLALAARAQAALDAALQAPERTLLVVTSAEALRAWVAGAAPHVREALPVLATIAASARLADAATLAGCGRVAVAASARPAALLHAAVEAFV